MTRRVVITGMGALTPIGNSAGEFTKALMEGKNGIDYITRFDAEKHKVKIAAEIKEYEPEKYLDRKDTKRMDMFSQYAMYAAGEALEDSGIDFNVTNPKRAGVSIGTGIGGLGTMEEHIIKMHVKGPSRIGPLFIPMGISNMAAGNIATRYGIKGAAVSVVTACASSNDCIGDAYRKIKHGYQDVMLAGGTEASITSAGIGGFASLTALSETNDINRSSIPFDKERSGFVMGEGAGVLILEELEHALNRNARIYAEITGYGATNDAYHMTSPHPEGEGAADAMLQAIQEAGIGLKNVDYISAHGTSTSINDEIETLAIKKLFGEYAYSIPVSSIKSMIGHTLGAAGVLEAISCIAAIQKGIIPPTINYKVKDENCDLNYVPNNAVYKEIKTAISNSFGFGGHNSVICIQKWGV